MDEYTRALWAKYLELNPEGAWMEAQLDPAYLADMLRAWTGTYQYECHDKARQLDELADRLEGSIPIPGIKSPADLRATAEELRRMA